MLDARAPVVRSRKGSERETRYQWPRFIVRRAAPKKRLPMMALTIVQELPDGWGAEAATLTMAAAAQSPPSPRSGRAVRARLTWAAIVNAASNPGRGPPQVLREADGMEKSREQDEEKGQGAVQAEKPLAEGLDRKEEEQQSGSGPGFQEKETEAAPSHEARNITDGDFRLARWNRGEGHDLIGDTGNRIDEAVVALLDLDVPRALGQAARFLPAAPCRPHELRRHALIRRAHYDGHRGLGWIVVDVQRSQPFEEGSVDGHLAPFPMMKKRQRIFRGQFLRPPGPEPDSRCDENQRRCYAAPAGRQRHERSERASDEHRRMEHFRFPERDAYHGLEVEAPKRRGVQVGRDDAKSSRFEKLAYRCDLSSSRRGSKAVQVENSLQAIEEYIRARRRRARLPARGDPFMKRTITRRAAGRLIIAAPVALSLPAPSAVAQEAPKPAPKAQARPKLSEPQRRELVKAEEGLEKAASAVRAMKIPLGTEPAFTFRPAGIKS